jgi:transposase
MQEPQVIADAEHEQVLDRVAAVDVAKASGMVCTRVPDDRQPGKRATHVWTVPATTRTVLELADHLLGKGIERVTVESTADYWRIWFYLLEARGLSVQLVNARDVKNVPGRPKTDKLDAVWLAKLTERGMLRPSFVPPAEIRVLRDYTRMRVDLTGERSRYVQRLEKLLEDALIKLSTVASDIVGVSGRQMIEALISGERDPAVLAKMAHGRMRGKQAALIEALTGRFDDHHGELARLLLDSYDALTTKINQLTTRIEERIAALPAAGAPPPDNDDVPADQRPLPAVDRLDEITGIGRLTAQLLIAELGLDMTCFLTAGHAVSWAKVCPRTTQSGTKTSDGRTGKGNPYLKGALGEAAAAAAHTNTFLGQRYRRLAKRKGKLKALVATARSILVIVWHLLADPTARFHDLGPHYHSTRTNTDRKTRSYVRQLEALGYEVTLTVPA